MQLHHPSRDCLKVRRRELHGVGQRIHSNSEKNLTSPIALIASHFMLKVPSGFDHSFWRSLMLRGLKGFCLSVAACFVAAPAFAAPTVSDCSNRVLLVGKNAEPGLLYKNSNVHGGRGFTFIIQPKKWRDYSGRRMLLDSQCNFLGYIGFWREVPSTPRRLLYCPYGTRYYSLAPGGSKFSTTRLRNKAREKTGSSVVLIQLKNNRWAVVPDPTQPRYGSVHNYPNDSVCFPNGR